jgi:DNA-binding NarL/FixJ family response regulator
VIVGRESELSALAAAVAAVESGESRVAALVGEAGIGKSALLAALQVRCVDGGLDVLAARAAEHESDVPFGVVIDALDDRVAAMGARRLESLGEERAAELAAILPSVEGVTAAGDVPSGPAERFRYHRALRALLELMGRERPFALMLDDLHWADAGSLELVLHLLRRPPRVPHLLVVALRPVDPLPVLLDALRGVPAADVLTLDPLDRSAALELVADVGDLGLRERIAAEAGGNPLFLRELARTASPGEVALPPTLLAAVQREIAALPPASRALLDGAAVSGDPFDPELAAAAAALDPGDVLVLLDRLVAADLVRPLEGPRRFGFRHPLVRRAVYEATPAGWRLAAHERVAALLERRGAPAGARAYHVEQFARPGDAAAIAALTEAAGAAATSSPGSAARWYQAALALLGDDAEPMQRAGLQGALALALGATGRLEDCRDAVVAALDLLPADQTDARIALTAACAEVENILARHADAEARLRRALVDAGDDIAPERRAVLELQLAWVATFVNDLTALVEHAEAAVAATAGSGTALEATASGTASLGYRWNGRAAESDKHLERAREVYARIGDQELAGQINASLALVMAELYAEAYQRTADVAARGIAVGRAFRQDRLLPILSSFRAMALWNRCDVRPALESVEVAEEAARLGGLNAQVHFALWQRAMILDLAGDAIGARRATAECLDLDARVELNSTNRNGRANLASVYAAEDPERAIATILRNAGPGLELVDPAWSTFHLLTLTRASIALGKVDDADRWALLSEQRADELSLVAGLVRAQAARAEVLLARGSAEEAAALALGAADAEQDGLRDLLDARLIGGRALAAAGRRDAAVAEFHRVAEEAAPGGARRLTDAADRELRRLGARVSAAARRTSALAAGSEELTEREQGIAELVVEGLSNKQVAARLFISEKTVENHLSKVYAKVGVRSRVELTRSLAASA